MSMLPAPGERPGLPSLPVLGESRRGRAMRSADLRCRRARRGPPVARVAQAADPRRGRDVVHAQPDQRAGPRDRLRECPLPESLGVLDPPHGDVHDPGRCLHPALRLLRGQARATRCGRPRRAGAPGRSLPAAGPAPRGHHLGHPRRPAGRRRRPLPPLRAGRAPADRRHHRGAHARFRRPRRTDRRRPLRPARGVQPQPRDGRPAPAARAGARASTRSASRCSSTSRKRARRSAPRAV